MSDDERAAAAALKAVGLHWPKPHEIAAVVQRMQAHYEVSRDNKPDAARAAVGDLAVRAVGLVIIADQDFERIWQAYPRHEARLQALVMWQEVGPCAALADTILAALAWQVQLDAWRRGYTPRLDNYLRFMRWTDEPPRVPALVAQEPQRPATRQQAVSAANAQALRIVSERRGA